METNKTVKGRGRNRPSVKPGKRKSPKDRQPPLIFIHRDFGKRFRSKDEARIIASHASGCYRRWERGARRKIVLDSSTRSILGRQSTSVEPTSCSTASAPSHLTSNTHKTYSGDDEDAEYQTIVSRLDAYHQEMLKPNDEHPLNSAPPVSHRTDHAWTRIYNELSLASILEPPPACLSSESPFFDPFSTSFAMLDPEVNSTLHFYFKVIRPFIRHLIPDWNWFDSLPEVQSKPVLAYAIAALSSTFLSGCLRGGPGVVLPPLPSDTNASKADNTGLLWPIPPWLRLQAMCVRELNKELNRQGANIDEGVFQAVLFLFRLAVLLADGSSGRMHLTALQQMKTLRSGRPDVDMGKELAVLRVNVIAAFLHSSSIVVVKAKRKGRTESHIVEVDRKDWPEREYWSNQAGMNGRLLAWGAGANEVGRRPSDWVQGGSDAAIERMDPGSRSMLTEAEWVEVERCYQISLYFVHYLNGISYSTGCDGIRGQLPEMIKRLSSIDLNRLKDRAPTTLFCILVAGAMASRGRIDRPWFIVRIGDFFEQVKWMDDVLALIEQFVDPFTVCWTVVEEIWEEVLESRLARWKVEREELKANRRVRLYKQHVVRPLNHKRPMSRQPDLKAERIVMEREIDGLLE